MPQQTAAPFAQDYCHCRSCRAYHGAPFIAAVVFKKTDFQITQGKDNLTRINITPRVNRYSCATCRSPICNEPTFLDDIMVSFPMLLDRNVGVATAVRTSVRAVVANPGAMAAWGLIVAALLLLGCLPALVGLAVVMPLLGHGTWHLYRKVVAS